METPLHRRPAAALWEPLKGFAVCPGCSSRCDWAFLGTILDVLDCISGPRGGVRANWVPYESPRSCPGWHALAPQTKFSDPEDLLRQQTLNFFPVLGCASAAHVSQSGPPNLDNSTKKSSQEKMRRKRAKSIPPGNCHGMWDRSWRLAGRLIHVKLRND